MKSSKLVYLPLLLLIVILLAPSNAQTASNPANLSQRDGSHDFDFLIANWKAHVRRLPDRLNNSTIWVEYDGISNHKKLLDSNANFEEFDVTSTDKKLRIKAQTLRLYNPTSHQWSIYLVDLDKGTLSLPPVVGQFTDNRGEFFDQKISKVEPFSCATSGSTSHPTQRGWSSHSRLMVGRPGKSIGFASFPDSRSLR